MLPRPLHPTAQNDATRPPRVTVFSIRKIETHVSRACGYEFEDMIAEELDDAALLAPEVNQVSRFMIRAKGNVSRYLPFAAKIGLGLKPAIPNKGCDLFFFSAAQPRDLSYLSLAKGWRENSRFAICWLQELWAADIRRLGHRLDKLNSFDHVICPFYHTTEYLRARLSVPVTYMTWGTDTALFNPFPNPPRRAIDICRIGEMTPETHKVLLTHADLTGKYYSYSTVKGVTTATSHRAHRHNYAGMLKRSQYFITYLAKMAQKAERGAQEEFGLRYIEAIATGAILLGDRPSNPAFDNYFGWEDAVIEAPYASPAMLDVIKALDADPARVERARRRNIFEALQRHDHLHRWEQILQIAGLEDLPQMAQRRTKLAELAAMAKTAPLEPSSPQFSLATVWPSRDLASSLFERPGGIAATESRVSDL